jgi:hypothetical protein
VVACWASVRTTNASARRSRSVFAAFNAVFKQVNQTGPFLWAHTDPWVNEIAQLPEDETITALVHFVRLSPMPLSLK